MKEPAIAYFKGEWKPASELAISVYDAGFVQGLTVAEQLRTFHGRLFRLDEHLDRLEGSLKVVGIDTGMDRNAWRDLAEQLIERNQHLVEDGDDLALALWVTPGPYPKYTFAEPGPVVCGHVHPIDFGRFQNLYEKGQRLVITDTRQVSKENWPVELKCRSRMHYYLADREARMKDSSARALLLDIDGYVCEASTANVIAFFESEGLVAPRLDRTLPGISLGAIDDLARELGIALTYRNIKPKELARADEILLSSTSPCVWPATYLDGEPVGTGKPGPVFQKLVGAWSQLVGVDIVAQAEQFAVRGSG